MTLKNYERNGHLSVGDHLEDLLQCCHHLFKPAVHLRVRASWNRGAKRGKPQKWPDVYFLLELFQWFQKEDDANDANDGDAEACDAADGENTADVDDNLNTSIWWLGCTSGIDFDCSAAILSDLLDALTTLSNYLSRKRNLEYIEVITTLSNYPRRKYE